MILGQAFVALLGLLLEPRVGLGAVHLCSGSVLPIWVLASRGGSTDARRWRLSLNVNESTRAGEPEPPGAGAAC